MSDHKHHIISLQTYIIVFAVLLFCTFITILTARPDLVPLLGLERTFFDFGSFNIVLALLIASFKSSLVLLFFMHLYFLLLLCSSYYVLNDDDDDILYI